MNNINEAKEYMEQWECECFHCLEERSEQERERNAPVVDRPELLRIGELREGGV
jgi:hypothetical protein